MSSLVKQQRSPDEQELQPPLSEAAQSPPHFEKSRASYRAMHKCFRSQHACVQDFHAETERGPQWT